MVLYIAADPGKDGAIACIDQDSKLISRISTPRIAISGPVDLTKEYVFCRDTIVENNPDRVVFVIEDVHIWPGQHVLYSLPSWRKRPTAWAVPVPLHGVSGHKLLVNFIAPKTWQKLVWTHSDKVMEASKVNTKKTSLAFC